MKGKILIAAALFLIILLAPTPPGLSVMGQRVLAVAVTTVVLWVSEAVPLGISALTIVILLVVTGGIHTLDEALVGFSSPIVFFLMGALVIATSVARSGLGEQIARLLIARARGNPHRLYAYLICVFPLLALILPSAITRNGILVPIYEQAFRTLQIGAQDGLRRRIMLALGILNVMASSAILTGGLNAMTAASLLGGFTWLRWFALMGVPYYTLMAMGALALAALHPSQAITCQVDHDPPSLTSAQRRVLLVIGLASALWLTDFIHHWSLAIPALLAAVLLMMPGLGGVITWRDFEQEAPWAMVLLVGAALSLSQAMTTSGAASWLGRGFQTLLAALPQTAAIFLIVVIMATAIVHLGILNMAACLALIIPIVTSAASNLGLNPTVAGLVVLISIDSIILYPVQTAASLVAYQAGYFNARDVFIYGVVMAVLVVVVILAIAIPWWQALGMPLVLR